MPADGAAFPGELYAGPYGFLAAIAFFLYLAARELRRYRQIDVETYKADVVELRTEAEEREARHAKEIAARENTISDLEADLAGARAEHHEHLRQTNLRHEQLLRESGALRALLATHGISTEGISG